jgi:hypothetical protein
MYLGCTTWIMDRLTPVSVKRWLRARLKDHKNLINQNSELTDMAIPALGPKSWSFYVNDVRKDCLNVLTICKLNDLLVKEAATKINQSRWKLQ